MRGGAVIAASTAVPALAQWKQGSERVLRIAHVTDCHIFKDRKAPAGFAKCLNHIQSQRDMPDLIMNGGDSIMDASGAKAGAVKAQWKLFKHVLHQECDLPLVHAIGNHDVWGWDSNLSSTTGKEAMYGKTWALDELGLSRSYYSFDHAGWHFIVLDSIYPNPVKRSYIGKLDEPQFQWLTEDLASTPSTTPVMVMSHIPFLSVAAYFRTHAEDHSYWVVPAEWMHIDARRIKDLFKQHPNVKLCISGHEHMVGEVKYLGTTYCCNGAVSGSWWQGRFMDTDPGYALIDLYADGTFKNTYVNWGWQA